MQTERVLQHSRMIKTIAVSRTEGCNRKLDHKLHSNERTRLPAGRGRLPQISRGNFDAFIVAVATRQCAWVNRIATVQDTAGVLNKHAHFAEHWSRWQNFAELVVREHAQIIWKIWFSSKDENGDSIKVDFSVFSLTVFRFHAVKAQFWCPK